MRSPRVPTRCYLGATSTRASPSGKHVDACLAELLWPRPATFCHVTATKACVPWQQLGNGPPNTGSRDQLSVFGPHSARVPLFPSTPLDGTGTVHRTRQSPASSTVARLQKGRDALGLCNSFPASPMRFWSVGLALPHGSVSSLRRHGSFDLPHGALRCSQSRQFPPSLGLDDERPLVRPVAAPRPLLYVFKLPSSGKLPSPGISPLPLQVRGTTSAGMARWVAGDGDRSESTAHNASSPSNTRPRVFDASRGTESEPASVPSGGWAYSPLSRRGWRRNMPWRTASHYGLRGPRDG